METIGFDADRFGLMLAAINVIIGLVLFLNFTADPPTERVFFEQSMRRGLRNPRLVENLSPRLKIALKQLNSEIDVFC